MRIRILKPPDAEEFAEFDVRPFRPGEVFDVAPRLATLLILAGNAEPVVGVPERSEAADSPDYWKKKDRKPFS